MFCRLEEGNCHHQFLDATTDVRVGALTKATSRALHLRLRRVVEDGGRHLRVDLSDVVDVDSSGVAVLIIFARLMPPLSGRLQIVRASWAVTVGLTSLHLAHMLPTGASAAVRPDQGSDHGSARTPG